MPTTVEKLPDAPIVIVHVQPSTRDLAEVTAEANAETRRVLDEQTESVFLLIDMSGISMGLDDILEAATMTARGKNAVLHHPRIRENIYVVTDGLIRMATKGLDNVTFGLLKTRSFDTVEEALEYCRKAGASPGF